MHWASGILNCYQHDLTHMPVNWKHLSGDSNLAIMPYITLICTKICDVYIMQVIPIKYLPSSNLSILQYFKNKYIGTMFAVLFFLSFGHNNFTSDLLPLFCIFSSCFLSCGTCGIYFNIKIIFVFIFGFWKYLSWISWMRRRRRCRLQYLEACV